MNVHCCVVGDGYLQSVISSDKWQFVFCRGVNTWSGELCKADVVANAKELGQEDVEYEKTALLALSSSKCSELCADVEDIENGVEISWKKITEGGVKYCLGSVKLTPSEDSQINEVLKNVIETISGLRNQLTNTEKQLALALAESKLLAAQMEDFARLKAESENELFAKFVLILNQKKAKIKSLKDVLRNGESGDNTATIGTRHENMPGTSKSAGVPPSSTKKEVKAVIHDDSFSEELQESLVKLPKRNRQKRTYPTVANTQPSKKIATNVKMDENAHEPEVDDTLDASEMIDGL